MLPGLDGLQVTKRLKEDPKTQNIPIVMLTARGEEADIVTGLELGAEDYITKPFSKKVLSARLKTVLRRRNAEPADEKSALKIGDLAIHPGRHEVLVRGRPVQLTFTEFGFSTFLPEDRAGYSPDPRSSMRCGGGLLRHGQGDRCPDRGAAKEAG